jgi:hypothetical protein
MTTRAISQFNSLWTAARQGGEQGYLVSYGELTQALAAIKADGKVTRTEAKAVADVMADDPFMTRPAVKEAKAFLAAVGANPSLDAATRAAMKAEFAAVAAKPFQHLDVPGRRVKSSIDLPDAVQHAIADTAEEGGGTWEEVETRSATLAGQKVFIVDYNSLDGEMDYEKVRIFSASGKQIAEGGIDDPMAGFAWH